MVRPDMTLNAESYRMEDGFVLVPFSAVRAVKDYIVVDKKASTQ
jgi:sporulation protein YlmC with PRC-barrel domain